MSARWLCVPFADVPCQGCTRHCSRIRLRCNVQCVAVRDVDPEMSSADLRAVLLTRPELQAIVDTGTVGCSLPRGLRSLVFEDRHKVCDLTLVAAHGTTLAGEAYFAHILIRPPAGGIRSGDPIILRNVFFQVPVDPPPDPERDKTVLLGMSVLSRLEFRTYCRERWGVLLQPGARIAQASGA